MSKKNNRFTCSQKLRVWALSDVFFDQHGVPEWSGWPRRGREFVEIWWGKAFERDFCLVRKALKILVVSNSQEYIEMLTHKIIRSQPTIYSNMSFLLVVWCPMTLGAKAFPRPFFATMFWCWPMNLVLLEIGGGGLGTGTVSNEERALCRGPYLVVCIISGWGVYLTTVGYL